MHKNFDLIDITLDRGYYRTLHLQNNLDIFGVGSLKNVIF